MQLNTVAIAHQLKIYSEACFCLLPAEDLDGQENKCMFICVGWTLWDCSVSLRGEVQIQEEYSRWERSEMIPLAAFNKEWSKQMDAASQSRPRLPLHCSLPVQCHLVWLNINVTWYHLVFAIYQGCNNLFFFFFFYILINLSVTICKKCPLQFLHPEGDIETACFVWPMVQNHVYLIYNDIKQIKLARWFKNRNE